MAQLDELYSALKAADAAGDTAGAQRLASYIQSMPKQQEAAPAKAPTSIIDKPNAVATGFNQGLLRMAGLPVDTMANVVDLGKAGIGGIRSLFTDKSPPDWLALEDRSKMVGSGQYLIDKAKESPAAPLVRAMNPEYEGGYLQAAGGGLNAIVNPNSRGEALTQGALGVSSALAGKAAIDKTGNPAWAVTASLAPYAAKQIPVAPVADAAAKRLMQSAIKPTIAQLRDGSAGTAVQTLLDYGINPTKGGVEKLRGLIDTKNTEIANEIGNSTATVGKQDVLNALGDVRKKFSNQVSPTSDLNAIDRVADDFDAHPNITGNDIPVKLAQEMKQGTYKVIGGKYGQLGSAETEAQKGLARGLKNEIAAAVPAVGPLNAEESKLITTLGVSERRALMEMNKNPLGLATLAHDPASFALFMADKSALFKSLAARMINTATKPSAPVNPRSQVNALVAPGTLEQN